MEILHLHYKNLSEFAAMYEKLFKVENVLSQFSGYQHGKVMTTTTLFKIIVTLEKLTNIIYTPNDILDFEIKTGQIKQENGIT